MSNVLEGIHKRLQKLSMIESGPGGYRVKSETGKNLGGPYKTRGEAEARLKEIEKFKHMGRDTKKSEALDSLRYLAREMKLAGEDELAKKVSCAISAIAGTKNPKTEYSYSSIMRELRNGDDERRLQFQRTFKDAFDNAIDEEIENPERTALLAAMQTIDFE